jgi:hypothetical protein
MALTWPLTEMSTRNLPGGKGRSERKADNLTVICEPTVYKIESLDVSQPYGSPRLVTGIPLSFYVLLRPFISSFRVILFLLHILAIQAGEASFLIPSNLTHLLLQREESLFFLFGL